MQACSSTSCYFSSSASLPGWEGWPTARSRPRYRPERTTSRMRIVYFNYEWDLRESSGAAAHIFELTSGLRRLGHEVVAVDRRRKPAGTGGAAGAATNAS